MIFMAQKPLVGQTIFTVEASRSHSDTPHSVGLLWASSQPDPATSTWQYTPLTTGRHPCPGGIFFSFRTRNSGKRKTADPRFRPRGH